MGCGNLPNSMHQGGMSKQRVECSSQAVSHWNIAGRPRNAPFAEFKSRARAAFRHEIKFLRESEDQLRSQSMQVKLQRGECNVSGRKLKHSILRRNSCLQQWEELLGAILPTNGKIISVQ